MALLIVFWIIGFVGIVSGILNIIEGLKNGDFYIDTFILTVLLIFGYILSLNAIL